MRVTAELTENGIDVKVSRKGSDGRMRIAMCGASNGRLNVYSIATESLSRARILGFELLLTRQLGNLFRSFGKCFQEVEV